MHMIALKAPGPEIRVKWKRKTYRERDHSHVQKHSLQPKIFIFFIAWHLQKAYT